MFVEFGIPNSEINSASDPTDCAFSTGPQRNCPEVAPEINETGWFEGTKSCSVILIPGEIRLIAIEFSLLIMFVLVQ